MRGSVDRRGADSWRVRVYLGRHPETGKRRFATRTVHGTRKDADEACAKLLLEVGAGFHASDEHTVADLMHRWLALVGPDLSPTTVRDYRSVIERHVIPAFGTRPIERVRASDLDGWYRTLELGAVRVKRIHNVMSSAFDQAVRWQWVAANPCRSARPPRAADTEIHPPSPETIRQLVEAAGRRHPDLAVYIQMSAMTGARRGELVALRWSDVDLNGGSIHIRRAVVDAGGRLVEKDTKTHAARTVALDPFTVSLLRTHRSRQAERALSVGVTLGDPRVFTSDPAGEKGWRPDFVTKQFGLVQKDAGLSGIRLHDLRHFTATQMIAAGIDIRTVAARLGHKRVATLLDRYSHPVAEADRAAATELARILRKG